MTPRKRRYQPPTMGEWHDSLDDIQPDARPERPPQPPPESNRRRRRKIAVARRSQAPVAPHGGYYYWCEHCDYCNKPDEGKKARCSNHERQAARVRKARQRKPPAARTTDGDYVISEDDLVALHARTRALRLAARAYEIALHAGNSAGQKRELDAAVRAMSAVVDRIPRPERR